MNIKYPVSFIILFISLLLTALLAVALHGWAIMLVIVDLLLIAALRFASHKEVHGWPHWVVWTWAWVMWFWILLTHHKSVG